MATTTAAIAASGLDDVGAIIGVRSHFGLCVDHDYYCFIELHLLKEFNLQHSERFADY